QHIEIVLVVVALERDTQDRLVPPGLREYFDPPLSREPEAECLRIARRQSDGGHLDELAVVRRERLGAEQLAQLLHGAGGELMTARAHGVPAVCSLEVDRRRNREMRRRI